MLVLSRQRDESVLIGDDITITIVDIRGDKVRLGINAPTIIPVHRQEVYEAIRREELRAGNNRQVVGRTEPGHPLRVVPLVSVHDLRDVLRQKRNTVAKENGPPEVERARLDVLNHVISCLDVIVAQAEARS